MGFAKACAAVREARARDIALAGYVTSSRLTLYAG